MIAPPGTERGPGGALTKKGGGRIEAKSEVPRPADGKGAHCERVDQGAGIQFEHGLVRSWPAGFRASVQR